MEALFMREDETKYVGRKLVSWSHFHDVTVPDLHLSHV